MGMAISIKSAAIAALSFLSLTNANIARNTWERDAPNTTAVPNAAYKNIVYLTNRSLDPKGRNFQPTDLPVSQITHIIYAFANVSSTGEVSLSKPSIDTEKVYHTGDPSSSSSAAPHGALHQLYLLKRSNRHLKTLLSLGGPSSTPSFSAATSSASSRSLFVNSALDLLGSLGLDGLDIDWEFPASKTEGDNYLLLLKDLRKGLDDYAASTLHTSTSPSRKRDTKAYHYLLTIASPTTPKDISNLCLSEIAEVIDWFNLIAYDYSGRWSKVSGHQSNLFSPVTSTGGSGGRKSTEEVVKRYLREGIPPGKIVLGMPVYGRAFRDTDGIGKPYGEAAEYQYKVLPGVGAEVVYDAAAGATYSYDEAMRELVSFDTPGMVTRKVRWLKEKGLAGSMFWEASMDRIGEGSLVGMSYRALGKVDEEENRLEYPDSVYENIRNGSGG
ncbi:glycoside hydrolase superfamily [Immersiella caudata]|uniref:chitinase n=1 Tax=Immersiella caudata TaxID=314043 RepID=A0AA39WSX0_9PEZI|nr:glycoside hydrolase superfamily [Immersiella caudata]